MQYEYDNLFKELLEWQSRRITLLTTSFTVVTGVLAFGQALGDRIPWWTVSVVLLFFLSAACQLTAYAGYVNQRFGAFFQVFHDPTSTLKWEVRNVAFGEMARTGVSKNLNAILWSFYLLLGLTSVALPVLMFKGSLPPPYGPILDKYFLDWLFVALAGVLFIRSLRQVRKSQTGRKELVDLWNQVRARETNASKTQAPSEDEKER